MSLPRSDIEHQPGALDGPDVFVEDDLADRAPPLATSRAPPRSPTAGPSAGEYGRILADYPTLDQFRVTDRSDLAGQ